MSKIVDKSKKMSFDQYENKYSIKQNIKQNKNKTQNKRLTNNSINQKKSTVINNSNSKNNNSKIINNSSISNKNSKQIPLVNKSKQHNQHDEVNAKKVNHINKNNQMNNMNNQSQQNKQLTQNRKSIPLAPISHQHHSQLSNHLNYHQSHNHSNQFHNPHNQSSHIKSIQQISKIDLIFEKQPQDVQDKLRKLLLNYNAVMQYNQQQDKFQVDLLLPFNTNEQKQQFIQKFMKTRMYIKNQIDQHQHNQHQNNNNHQQQIKNISNNQKNNQSLNNKSSLNNSHYHNQSFKSNKHLNNQKNQSHINHSHHNQSSLSKHNNNNKQINREDQIQEQQAEGQNNVLSTSIRQQTLHTHQLTQIKSNHSQIDFFALSNSLDLSIKRGLSLIHQSKLSKQHHQPSNYHQNPSNSIQINYNPNQPSNNHSRLSNVQNSNVTQQQQTMQQHRYDQSHSQNQSQISDGIQANVPHSIQRNLSNTPSGRKNSQQARWFKPLQPNQSQGKLANSSLQYSQAQNSRLIKPDRSLYESPIVPYKNALDYEKSNASSNQILIEDEPIDLDYYDSDAFQTPQKYNSYHIEQDSYNSAFDMIEQISQQQEQDHYPSSKEYKQFLKNKLNDTAKGTNNSNYQPGMYQQQRQNSSLRKKYGQFLKKNHKRIQNLYLRIGKQMRKRKQQQQFSYPYSQKRKQQASSQILVSQNQDSINQKEGNEELLQNYKRRIVIQNDSMSSEDKVRYFRYLARHAKALYIDFIRGQSGSKKNILN